jgi:hypothetical protein
MATIGELIINVKADTAAFAGDLTRVKNVSFDTASQIQRSFQIIGAAAIGMIGTFGAGMAAMIDKAAEFETHVLHLSESAGVTTETMSGLGFAAKMMGLNMDDVAKAMERFDKQLLQAQMGKSSAVDLMKTLGIDPVQIKTSDDALKLLADHFAAMPNGALKTGEAIAAFGKAGAAMIPILNQGSAGMQQFMDQARALGVIVGEDAANSAQHFTQDMTILSAMFEGFGLQITNNVLPNLNALLDDLLKNAQQTGILSNLVDLAANSIRIFGTFVAAGSAAVSYLSDGFRGLGAVLVEIGRVSLDTMEAMAASISGQFGAAHDAWIRAKEDFAGLGQAFHQGLSSQAKDFQQFGNMLADVWGKGEAAASKSLNALGAGFDSVTGKMTAQEKEIENIIKHYDELGASVNKSKLDIDLYKLSVDGATHAQEQHVLELGLATEKLKATSQALRELQTAQDTYAGKSAAGAGFTKEMDDELKALNGIMAASDQLRTVPPALTNIGSGLRSLTPPFEDVTNHVIKLQGYFRQWGQQMSRDFTSMITGAKSFSQVLNDILNQVIELLMKQALLGSSHGGGGGLFGVLGGLIGGLFGGSSGFSSSLPGLGGVGSINVSDTLPSSAFTSLMGFASGGDVSAGQPIMVGENGPEVFTPDRSGAIIPNGEGSGAGGVTVQYNIDARGADPSVDRKIRDAMKQTHDQAVKNALALSREIRLRTA